MTSRDAAVSPCVVRVGSLGSGPAFVSGGTLKGKARRHSALSLGCVYIPHPQSPDPWLSDQIQPLPLVCAILPPFSPGRVPNYTRPFNAFNGADCFLSLSHASSNNSSAAHSMYVLGMLAAAGTGGHNPLTIVHWNQIRDYAPERTDEQT